MRFVDASVFVHAFIKPKRGLRSSELKIKNSAKEIVKKVRDGEDVSMTIVQLAEIANLLGNDLPVEEAFEAVEFLLFSENIKIYSVAKGDCLRALTTTKDKKIRLSDAIAYTAMVKNRVKEIYSFDKNFDKLEVRRLKR